MWADRQKDSRSDWPDKWRKQRTVYYREKWKKKHPIHIVTISIYSSHNFNPNVLYNKKFKKNM